MAAFNDFAIDPCIAAQLKVCLKIKECLQAKLGPLSAKAAAQLGGNGGSSPAISANTQVRATLDDFYACLLENLQNAYNLAGETFPPIPTLPSSVDFGPSAALASPIADRAAAGALDFLSSVMTIEFDGNGNPTFIRCP